MYILSPKTDVIFKLLFGDPRNKDILTDFLKAVLNFSDDEFDDIEITDPHLKRSYPGDKLGILDVKLKTKNKNIIDIEIQVLDVPEMRSRMTYYLSNMITEQLKSGDKYIELKRAVCIVITAYPLIKESERCHTVFQMLEKTEHFPFNDLMQINILDLTKANSEKDENLASWLNFIKADKEEEFEMATKNNEVIGTAYARLKELSKSEANKLLYESRLKAQRDELSRIDGALRQGRSEGMAKGKLERNRFIVKNAFQMNMPIDSIMKLTGLTHEEIQSLQNTN